MSSRKLLQVTLCGKPVGRPVYAEEIADQLAECAGMRSRRAKRRRCKARRRQRLREKRAQSSLAPEDWRRIHGERQREAGS